MDALRFRRSLGCMAVALFWASLAAAGDGPAARLVPTTRESPDGYGTSTHTVTVIPATAFTSDDYYVTDYGSLARYFPFVDAHRHYRAGVSVPSGAVIDYIGLECASSGSGELTASLVFVDRSGNVANIASLGNTPHGFSTDYNSDPLGWGLDRNVHNELVIDVDQAPNSEPLFGWIEIWWRRRVSPPPAMATFTDVPTTHLFFQFVEALHAAGITNGYPDGRFGVNDPITRGQMAVFLSTALGLNWPY